MPPSLRLAKGNDQSSHGSQAGNARSGPPWALSCCRLRQVASGMPG